MPKPLFTLDAEGYFTRAGRRLFPYGVNYWPGSCGVEMWRTWPVEEIRNDLRTMQTLGMNCVRFFVRWQDFEPASGKYRALSFRRLAQFLGWCREFGLVTQPSLFVGWMSGGIFWPEWKAEKNLFADPELRRRSMRFAEKVAQVCARHEDVVLAVDLGNEICCLPDCMAARPVEVESWCAGVTAAVRRAFPTTLIIAGNEQAQVTADTGWRFGRQPGSDLYSMHTYPMSPWHSLAFDGMTDPLGQSLFPFYLKCARAFGPVMMQEFGTIFTTGTCCDTYLRAMLPAAWEAGANGFLWWSLRDFTARGHPYNKNAFEGPLGVAGEDDLLKPVLRYFGEFAASLPQRAVPPVDQGEIALYWPANYYHRDEPLNPGNEPRTLSRRMAIAHFTLTQLGHRVGIVRGDLPLKNCRARTIVIAGAQLTAVEVEALAHWVKAGGQLIWHGVDVTTWGTAMNSLLGADAADIRAPRARGVRAFGALWHFAEFPRDVMVDVVVRQASVLASDDRGRAIVLRNRCGRGVVVACVAQPDDQFAAESAELVERPRWLRWYRGMLTAAS